jgi:hypothetical protein
VAHLFEIVIFPPRARAWDVWRDGLRRILEAEKDALELHHPGVGEQKRRIVAERVKSWGAPHALALK